MKRLAIIAALGLALGFAVKWQLNVVSGLRAEIREQAAQLEQAEIARKAHEEYVEQAERERKAWQETVNELQGLEGRDAPLSDHMRAAADRLWR